MNKKIRNAKANLTNAKANLAQAHADIAKNPAMAGKMIPVLAQIVELCEVELKAAREGLKDTRLAKEEARAIRTEIRTVSQKKAEQTRKEKALLHHQQAMEAAETMKAARKAKAEAIEAARQANREAKAKARKEAQAKAQELREEQAMKEATPISITVAANTMRRLEAKLVDVQARVRRIATRKAWRETFLTILSFGETWDDATEAIQQVDQAFMPGACLWALDVALRNAVGMARELSQRIEAIREQLKAIAKSDDPVKATEAKGELAKKYDAREDVDFSANVAKRHYGVRVAIGLLGNKERHLLARIAGNDDPEESVTLLEELKAFEERHAADGYSVKESATIRRSLSESELADAFGIQYGRNTRMLFLAEHDFYGQLHGKGFGLVNDLVPELVDQVHNLMVERLVNHGVTLTTRKGEPLDYKLLYVNSSEAKKGTAMMAEAEAYAKTIPFLTLGQGLAGNPSQAFSGQQLMKALAVMGTPSTPINLGTKAKPRYITMDSVIMLPKMTVRIKIPRGVHVGHGDAITVQMPLMGGASKTVSIPVTKVDDTTATLDAFDGLLVARIKGLQPTQARGGGMKGLTVSDRAQDILVAGWDNLVDLIISQHPEYGWMAGAPVDLIDIDGNVRRFEEGMIATTLTTWKASVFFDGEAKPWQKLCSNLASLRTKVTAGGTIARTFGVLRQAMVAEIEYDHERHTSRSMLQNLLALGSESVEELVTRTIRNAKAWKTFEGAMHRFAGYSRKETGAMERLFRLCPELAAERHFRDLAIAKYRDAVADAASCRLNVDGINAFLGSDPAAFVEALLSYASTGNLDVTDLHSLLGDREYCCWDLEDQQEAVMLRYPLNAGETALAVNNRVDAYRFCGRAVFVSFKSTLIVLMDADFDGDHVQLILDGVIIEAQKASEKIRTALNLDRIVVFDHDGKEERGAYNEAFVNKGIVDAIVNGQAFNMVGPFANAAARFGALSKQAFEAARLAASYGNMAKRQEQLDMAIKFGLIQKVFATGAILCIDWAKKGLPSKESEGYKVYETCLTLREWAAEPFHGKALWEQIFCDHDVQKDFSRLSQPEERISMAGNKYKIWRYAKPAANVADWIAQEVCRQADIKVTKDGTVVEESLAFDSQGVTFDPSMLGWQKPAMRLGTCAIQQGVIDVDPAGFETKLDRTVAETIVNGAEPRFRDFVIFLYHAAVKLERRLADRVDEAKTNEDVEDERLRAKMAFRSIVLTADIHMVGSAKEIYDRKIDELLDLALELTRTNNVGEKDDTELAVATKKARFTRWIFDVFADDILFRVEEMNDLPKAERVANIAIRNLKKAKEDIDDVFAGVAAPDFSDDEIARMVEFEVANW